MRNPITLNRSWRAKMTSIFSTPVLKLNAFLLSLCSAFMLTAPTLCSETNVQFNTNLTEDELVGGVLSVLIKFAYIAGALVLAGGIFAYIWARKEEDSRGQGIALTTCATGVLLVGFETILRLIGVIS